MRLRVEVPFCFEELCKVWYEMNVRCHCSQRYYCVCMSVRVQINLVGSLFHLLF